MFIFLTFNFQLFHKSLLSSIYFITNEVITEKSIFYIFIAFSLLLIIVFSKIIIFRNVKIVLYIILSTIIFVDTFSLLKKYYFTTNNSILFNFEILPKLQKNIKSTKKTPNVYLIIPDGMPSPKQINNLLYEDYEYKVTQKLEDLGFVIIENAKTNGMDTQTAITHFFSMNYI